MLRLRPAALPTVLAVSLALLATIAALPPGAAADQRQMTVRVYDAGGAALLYEWAGTVNAPSEHLRFAVASFGRSAVPSSGLGVIALDNLLVYPAQGQYTAFDFTTAPTVIESSQGNDEPVMVYNEFFDRLDLWADSAQTCTGNYQSIAIDPSVRRIQFQVTRTTGTPFGEGSFWDVIVGITPSDDEPIGPACFALPTLLGFQIGGSGDYDPGDRSLGRAWPGIALEGSPEMYVHLDVPYLVDVTLT